MMITRDDILQLSVAERILLAEDIWDTIVDSPESLPLSHEQQAELDRRLTAIKNSPDAGSSWSEVRNRIRTRA